MGKYREGSTLHPLIPFVLSGRVRKGILIKLRSKPMIPSHIAKQLECRAPSVSRAISSLKREGLLIPIRQTRGRVQFYALTKEGRKVADEIKTLGHDVL